MGVLPGLVELDLRGMGLGCEATKVLMRSVRRMVRYQTTLEMDDPPPNDPHDSYDASPPTETTAMAGTTAGTATGTAAAPPPPPHAGAGDDVDGDEDDSLAAPNPAALAFFLSGVPVWVREPEFEDKDDVIPDTAAAANAAAALWGGGAAAGGAAGPGGVEIGGAGDGVGGGVRSIRSSHLRHLPLNKLGLGLGNT